MRKIYSLLLLGGLLLLGVESVTAGNYVRGNWDGWAEHWFTTWDGSTSSQTIYLPYNSSLEFEIRDGEGGTGDGTTKIGGQSFASGDTEKALSKGDVSNCTITTTEAGAYTFTIRWDGANPYLTITYPTGTSYTVAYTNSSNWPNVYVYAYYKSGDDDVSVLGGWPGVKVASPYSLTFKASTEPTKIIWNNGGYGEGNQSYTLDFANNAVYNYSAVVSIPVTDDGYATFFANCKVQVPSGVTAYTGTYNSSANTLTLNALTGTNTDVVSNTPVVLKRTSGSGAITLTAVTSEAGEVSGTNNLHGTSSEIAKPANSYVLGYTNTEHTAFYPYTGTNIAANKAYLVISGGAAQAGGIRIIEEGNDATSIDAIEASEKAVKFFENGQLLIRKDGVVYDMTGRVIR